MQTNTLTITTDTMTTSFGANFQITTFEQTISAFCDCCDNQSNGTKEELTRRGWGFGNGSEFCPDCN